MAQQRQSPAQSNAGQAPSASRETSSASGGLGRASAVGSAQSKRGNAAAMMALGAQGQSDPALATADEHYADQSALGTLEVNGYSADDVVQSGGTSDCYFLAALASVASQSPDAIKSMIRDDGGGKFSVRFFGYSGRTYDEGVVSEVWVRSSKTLPVTAAGGLAYGHSEGVDDAGKRELWVSVVEKAFASFVANELYVENWLAKVGHGNADSEAGGDAKGYAREMGGHTEFALRTLTGGAVSSDDDWEGKDSPDQEMIWDDLVKALDAGKPVVVSTAHKKVLFFFEEKENHSESVIDYRGSDASREILVHKQEDGDPAKREYWYPLAEFVDHYDRFSSAKSLPSTADSTDVPTDVGGNATRFGFASAILAVVEGVERDDVVGVALAAAERGIFAGTFSAASEPSDVAKTLRLADTVNRAEAAKMIIKAFNIPETLEAGSFTPFSDVSDPGLWYYTYAHITRQKGIFHGDAVGNTFRPTDTLATEELKALVTRLPP